MSRRRLITIVIGYGQSNEKGISTVARNLTPNASAAVVGEWIFGHTLFGSNNLDSNTNDLGAFYIACTGAFNTLAELIAMETGADVELVNLAKGNTSPVTDWWGWDTNTLKLADDGGAGFDPYANVIGCVNAVKSAKERGREVWVITAGGQKDIGRLGGTGMPAIADTIEANRRIQQKLIDNGADRTFVGITPIFLYSGTGTDYRPFWTKPDGFVHVVQRALLSNLPKSFAGADLSDLTDANLYCKDGTPYIHTNHAGNQVIVEKWLDAIRASGALN